MDRVCARVCRRLHEVCCMLRAEGCLRSHVARRFFACHTRHGTHGSAAAGVDGCASSASCQLNLEAVRAHTHTATHAHTRTQPRTPACTQPCTQARAHARMRTYARSHARRHACAHVAHARTQPEPCGTSAQSAQCRLPLALVPSVRTAWCLKAPQGREQGRVQSAGGSPPTRHYVRGCRCFETGSVDEFRFSLPHLGELTKVRLLARISARYAMPRSAQRSAAQRSAA